MKYSIGMKILAIVLAAVALTVTVAGSVGIIAVAGQGLYWQEYDVWIEQFYQLRTESLARAVAESYAARHMGNLSAQELQFIGWGNSHKNLSEMWNMDPESWAYSIYSSSDVLLEEEHPLDVSQRTGYINEMRVDYPVRVLETGDWSQRVDYWISEGREQTLYLQFRESPQYKVIVWITPGGIESFSGIPLGLYEILAYFRYWFIVAAVAGLLLTATCVVYLCFAAGKKEKDGEKKPGGLNRLPLDLYGAGLGVILLFLYICVVEVTGDLLVYEKTFVAGCVLDGCILLAAGLCVIGFLFALAAQWKMDGHYIWQHSLIGWVCSKLWMPVKRGWKGLCKLYGVLPLVWKYLLIACAMGVAPVLCGFLCLESYGWGRAFWMLMLLNVVAADIAMVCYGAYAYGTVLKGAKAMTRGDLNTKVDTRHLRGSYKTCADDLNVLADVAVDAAKKQMKSERMKAELVTNVSHDIKTPLTSVINYIDLMQKAEDVDQQKQYLEVLDRQSQKLKKLIDDLMEMSKATTGDMAVEITSVNAVEAVTQALGEFADKLERQELSVVFRKPEEPVQIRADGRLTWRVLSNLMSNVVKYALPGTRVYAEVMPLESSVQISLKNISREELNVSADELTERFVRGDASRNTEGSGLGLNIAKSLMELQKGSLDLTIDGDLFKVTLTFPADK